MLVAWIPFVTPMPIKQSLIFWLMIPLCLAVIVVYRTVRTTDVKKLPAEILRMSGYLAGAILLLGVSLWVIMRYAL